MVSALVGATILVLAVGCGDRGDDGASATTTAGTTLAGTPGQTGSATQSPGQTPAPEPADFRHQPLWPFATVADAALWQQSYRQGGHQPWHLDPAAVALGFTQGYLGYDNVDRSLLVTTKGQESWVTVGFNNPNGVGSPVAMLHLVRIGTGDDAPWEVVGTEDRTLSITAPAYGAQVGSPLTAGGRITGVDESLNVQVRQLDRAQPVGELTRIPAGGENTPWTASVPFTASCPGSLTIAVVTGGHVEAVERFAVTGVRC